MKTFVVAGSKGGAGETTIAANLAAQAALRGVRTVLADADPQKSSTRWTERRAITWMKSGAVCLPSGSEFLSLHKPSCHEASQAKNSYFHLFRLVGRKITILPFYTQRMTSDPQRTPRASSLVQMM